jgi:phosphoribosylanthranilate isomerase
VSTLVKICGLSTPATLGAALAAGADRVGFIFFPKSPRHVSVDTAARLAEAARGRAVIVALTVDADDETLAAIVAGVRPDMLQLHGRETPDRIAALRARFGRPVVKALGVSTPGDLGPLHAYAAVADEILFDAKPPPGALLPGGNGRAFDWRMLAALDLAVPFMLSGGLRPDNVGEAMRVTRAPAVDVSSGVESAPGVKDPDLIAAFVGAARAAAGAPRRPPIQELQP